ncbi:MAG: hypothetical protein DRP56_02045 [Planctomycetota bacterium]|nr:MAG: hypothetical protein DRP56_02045 [Planctomycetota bacterium]
MYLGDYEIGSAVLFNFQALDGNGQAVDADATPTYEVYVNNAPMSPAITGEMAKIDGQTGFYGGDIAATAAAGFEAGNTYTIRIAATIDGADTLTTDTFQISANSATTTTAAFEETDAEANQVSVDAANIFDAAAINTSGAFKSMFGRSIIVLPDGVSERAIVGIVDYAGVSAVPGMGEAKSYELAITVDNNAVTGLSADEFDSGVAKCKLPKRQGATATLARIVKIINQDAGMVKYEVR